MIVTLNEVLKDAQKNRYAVGLFNAINLEMARGIISAAEKLNSPVIIGTAEVLLKFTPLQELSYFLIPMAQKAKVPVVVHFDHGLTGEKVIEAMRCGFSSVMYDCSTKSYEENIRETAEMTKIARIFGASIEAELGHVGANKDKQEDSCPFTDPEEAAQFCEKTGVDALAVAIGTAHGAYKEKPKLDLERLDKIAHAVDTPLVLHGGSGLSDEDFKACIKRGICKVNIFTDVNCAASRSVFNHFEEGKGMSLIVNEQVKDIQAAAEEKIKIFGSENRA